MFLQRLEDQAILTLEVCSSWYLSQAWVTSVGPQGSASFSSLSSSWRASRMGCTSRGPCPAFLVQEGFRSSSVFFPKLSSQPRPLERKAPLLPAHKETSELQEDLHQPAVKLLYPHRWPWVFCPSLFLAIQFKSSNPNSCPAQLSFPLSALGS